MNNTCEIVCYVNLVQYLFSRGVRQEEDDETMNNACEIVCYVNLVQYLFSQVDTNYVSNVRRGEMFFNVDYAVKADV